MLRRSLGGLVPLFVSAVALAQPAANVRGMRLDYQRAPGIAHACPDEEAFRRADIDTAGDVIALADGTTASPRAGFAGGTLAPCVHASWFFGCALATLGHVRASAGDATQPTDGAGVYFGLGGRAGLEIPLLARKAPKPAGASSAPPAVAMLRAPPLLAVQLAADGPVTVVRPGVLVNGEELWRAPIAAGLFGARLVTIF